MKEKILFELSSVYRDNMRIKGYSFGGGEPSVCIIGATRGNEVQQLYICSRLINIFKQLEHQGKIRYGKTVMVVPTVNSHSMNIGKRFWSTDNTDINRMFPGYNLGETTQRIAAGVFENINAYRYGIQFTSFYMQGDYIPHVRVMQTGFEDIELAKDFGGSSGKRRRFPSTPARPTASKPSAQEKRSTRCSAFSANKGSSITDVTKALFLSLSKDTR